MALPLRNEILTKEEQRSRTRDRRMMRKKIDERVEELQEAGLDCDPVKVLMELACGKAQGPDGVYRPIVGAYDEDGNPLMLDAVVRVKAASELMSYLYPKRKAIELSGNEGSPITFAVVADTSDLPPGTSAEISADDSDEALASGREPLTLIGNVEDDSEESPASGQ